MLPLTPTKLGRYEITDEIGKGAMGVVYLARDPLIGRLVALKTFRIGYSVRDQEMEQFRIRFMREAQSAGILTHPNIVTIHDVVESSEEGMAFIAMEYVRGTNLKLLLQGDQALGLPFVLDVIAQVGDALDYAHSNRVVHRDVKPANILITTDNRVKITDFGIARLDSSNLTQEGQLLGTPNYMAPEQIQGKEVDHRADLFSLGVVLYELLTRHKPFQGENLTVVSHRIVYDHFTPPREYVQNLPPGLEPILMKALEKDPARRYQRAREMVDDLRRLVDASRQRDDLNETQSLSSTMVLPPPPVPTPPAAAAKPSMFSRWRKEPAPQPVPPAPLPAAGPPPLPPPPPDIASGVSEDTISSGVTPPPPPSLSDTNATSEVPVLTAPPPPPKAVPAGRSSSRQTLAVAGIVVLLGVLLGAGFLLWKSWSQPKGVQSAAADARPVQPVPVTPPPTPAEATPAVPQPEATPALPVASQQLDFARQALTDKRYDAAIAGAKSVLWIDPANAEATSILAKATKAQAHVRQKPVPAPHEIRPGEQVATTPAVPETPARPSASQLPSSVATTANLHVHLATEFPGGGVLIVYVDGREKLREDLPSWGSFFRAPKAERHYIDRNIEVPAGAVSIRVHVALPKRPAQVRPLSGNFTGGGSHPLEVQLSAAGQVDASLR
ncbi:MAG: eukaryotic-like serine/threonine-protein kinase [Acidobacteriota bacterium]|jgi:serine/threonine protein kinase|nr:eukaryotic-like serine/threonine-protein kinase [Acidobacteriota bacterium]